jgi:hypothetical protein
LPQKQFMNLPHLQLSLSEVLLLQHYHRSYAGLESNLETS